MASPSPGSPRPAASWARSGTSPVRSSTGRSAGSWTPDRKSTRLNSSHTVIYTLSLHDALPIYGFAIARLTAPGGELGQIWHIPRPVVYRSLSRLLDARSEEHTSELQSHRDLHSFPTRRSSDLWLRHRPAHRARRRAGPDLAHPPSGRLPVAQPAPGR